MTVEDRLIAARSRRRTYKDCTKRGADCTPPSRLFLNLHKTRRLIPLVLTEALRPVDDHVPLVIRGDRVPFQRLLRRSFLAVGGLRERHALVVERAVMFRADDLAAIDRQHGAL